uniref:Uncharacterized protein n=1 Tax=Plectus sambesii TaxID=2011161 RepID=A0A914X490_9BILA
MDRRARSPSEHVRLLACRQICGRTQFRAAPTPPIAQVLIARRSGQTGAADYAAPTRAPGLSSLVGRSFGSRPRRETRPPPTSVVDGLTEFAPAIRRRHQRQRRLAKLPGRAGRQRRIGRSLRSEQVTARFPVVVVIGRNRSRDGGRAGHKTTARVDGEKINLARVSQRRPGSTQSRCGGTSQVPSTPTATRDATTGRTREPHSKLFALRLEMSALLDGGCIMTGRCRLTRPLSDRREAKERPTMPIVIAGVEADCATRGSLRTPTATRLLFEL